MPEQQFWTTVGSAAALNQADLAKVTLHQSIIQLGLDLGGTTGAATAQAATATPRGVIFPTIQAVARYNVTPVDGVFFPGTGRFRYSLQIRFRGHITAKLMQVNILDGTETQLILFDSTKFPTSVGFQTQRVDTADDSQPLDFVNNAFYVEATLIAPAVVVGEVAAISIIKLLTVAQF
jgi:hypothetical protein